MARKPRQTLEQYNPRLADQLVDQSLRSIAKGSSKKVQWRCPKDPRHIYTAAVMNRTAKKNPTGCSVCSGRTVIPGVNDVATTHPKAARLMVDKRQRKQLTAASNKHVTFSCPNPHHEPWRAPLSNVAIQKTGCPYCSGRKAVKKKNDLATTHPTLAKQLVDQRQASELKAGSSKKVIWRCPKNSEHLWEATPFSRTSKNTGCPYCSGRIITPGINDLATTHPELASQLIDPTQAVTISKDHDKHVEWVCSINSEHTWFASPANRIKSSGCPQCYAEHNNLLESAFCDTIAHLVPDYSVLRNDHTILPSGKELDLVIPELKLAIEFNGVFWHSEAAAHQASAKPRHYRYHESKSSEALKQGYQLIHIWEDDWVHRKELVLRSLAHRLHANHHLIDILPDLDPRTIQRLYARDLVVKEVSGTQAATFWKENHLQGHINCSLNLGLYDKTNTLRALLGVGRKNHGSRVTLPEGTWDIQRYATFGTIVGGFSRLLSHAEQRYPINTWLSWSDNDISDGSMYQAAGFTKFKKQPASYSYVGKHTGWQRAHRSNFTKQRFVDDPKLTYTPGQTEHQAALANQLYRIYDAGKTQWVKTITPSL